MVRAAPLEMSPARHAAPVSSKQVTHRARFDRSLRVAFAHPGPVPQPRRGRHRAVHSTDTTHMTRMRQPGEHRLAAIHEPPPPDQHVGQLPIRHVGRIERDHLVDQPVQPIQHPQRTRHRHTRHRHASTPATKITNQPAGEAPAA
ncbi:MAG: hypothetical protein ACXW1M_06790, partial [Acidimicrobiia bacterium]